MYKYIYIMNDYYNTSNKNEIEQFFEITDEDSIGIWDFFKNYKITREIFSNSLEIDVNELIKDINEIIKLHLGNLSNIDTVTDFIQELKINIKNLYMSEETSREIYEKIIDEDSDKITNIMFYMNKKEKTNICQCNLFNLFNDCKSYIISIRLVISRPSNKIAIGKCNKVMNFNITKQLYSKAMN